MMFAIFLTSAICFPLVVLKRNQKMKALLGQKSIIHYNAFCSRCFVSEAVELVVCFALSSDTMICNPKKRIHTED